MVLLVVFYCHCLTRSHRQMYLQINVWEHILKPLNASEDLLIGIIIKFWVKLWWHEYCHERSHNTTELFHCIVEAKYSIMNHRLSLCIHGIFKISISAFCSKWLWCHHSEVESWQLLWRELWLLQTNTNRIWTQISN